MTVKGLTLLFSTLLLVTGCSKSEVVTSYEKEVAKQVSQPAQQAPQPNADPVAIYTPSDVPITFGLYTGQDATTRAAVSTPSDLAREGFSVFAYYTGQKYFPGTNGGVNEAQWRGDEDPEAGDYLYPNMMYNQLITGVFDANDNFTGEWNFNPWKYWPNNPGDKVTFFAYGTHVNVTQENPTGKAGARGNDTGITHISGNAYNKGTPVITYSLSPTSGYVEMGDMEDLLYGKSIDYTYTTVDNVTKTIPAGSQYYNMEKPVLSAEPITFSFNHALAAFGFGVCGVFNEDTRGKPSHTSSDYEIYDDNFIRIEDIYITAVLPLSGELDLVSGAWTVAQNAAGTDYLTDEVEFHFDASNIAENLRYYPYGADLDNYAGEEREAYIAAQTTVAAQNLSFGVGRYKNAEGHKDGDPISNNSGIYQKVGLTGSAQNNVFYFIPASSTGAVTFNIKIKYHTLTSDPRSLYGLSDIVNVVENSKDITVTGGNEGNGRIYMFNLQLGMTKVKINSVTAVDYYLTNEDSTPYDMNDYTSNKFYYTVPKDESN